MTETELRELDAFCAEFVMEWLKVAGPDRLDHNGRYCTDSNGDVIVHGPRMTLRKFQPTTSPADALAVLAKCVERLGFDRVITFGQTADGSYFMNHSNADWDSESFCSIEADTMPLLISRFSKQLFSK